MTCVALSSFTDVVLVEVSEVGQAEFSLGESVLDISNTYLTFFFKTAVTLNI